jgi:hypothetical protein
VKNRAQGMFWAGPVSMNARIMGRKRRGGRGVKPGRRSVSDGIIDCTRVVLPQLSHFTQWPSCATSFIKTRPIRGGLE